MTRTFRRTLAATAFLVAVTAAITGCTSADDQPHPPAPAVSTLSSGPMTVPAALQPVTAARTFLDQYVDPDGRVVRRDQGGDTVSEGQAYALELAVRAADRTSFARIWEWTAAHLQRPDRLLSWHWQGGRVSDRASAADADLDAADALVHAGERFGDPRWREAGVALGRAVLDRETVVTPLGRLLVAGDWARSAPWSVNPSYLSWSGARRLDGVSPDPRWAELTNGWSTLLRRLLAVNPLVPDWARVSGDGRVDPASAPSGRAAPGLARFGADAVRTPLRALAAGSGQVSLALALARPLVRPVDQVHSSYDLRGGPLTSRTDALTLVATAAAARAVNPLVDPGPWLTAAVAADQRHPTYYAAAWLGLAAPLFATGPAGDEAATSRAQ